MAARARTDCERAVLSHLWTTGRVLISIGGGSGPDVVPSFAICGDGDKEYCAVLYSRMVPLRLLR